MRITYIRGLLLNLKEEVSPNNRKLYMTKEKAYLKLREYTGEDFGYDTRKWQEWLKTNKLE